MHFQKSFKIINSSSDQKRNPSSLFEFQIYSKLETACYRASAQKRTSSGSGEWWRNSYYLIVCQLRVVQENSSNDKQALHRRAVFEKCS